MTRASASSPAAPWRRALVYLGLGALAGFLALDLGLPLLVSWWHGDTPLVLGCAVAGLVAGRWRGRALVGGGTALLGLLWLAVAFTPLVPSLLPALARADAIPARADAIFVFASSMQADGDPTTASLARLVRGLELLGERRALRLILSELPPPIPSYAALARTYMDHLDLDGELLAVGPVRNSRDEAVAVARLCRERGYRTVIAVSSPTHLRRAAASLEREGLTVFAVPAAETRFDLDALPTARDRLRAFGPVLHDLIGFQVYRWRGWIDG